MCSRGASALTKRTPTKRRIFTSRKDDLFIVAAAVACRFVTVPRARWQTRPKTRMCESDFWSQQRTTAIAIRYHLYLIWRNFRCCLFFVSFAPTLIQLSSSFFCFVFAVVVAYRILWGSGRTALPNTRKLVSSSREHTLTLNLICYFPMRLRARGLLWQIYGNFHSSWCSLFLYILLLYEGDSLTNESKEMCKLQCESSELFFHSFRQVTERKLNRSRIRTCIREFLCIPGNINWLQCGWGRIDVWPRRWHAHVAKNFSIHVYKLHRLSHWNENEPFNVHAFSRKYCFAARFPTAQRDGIDEGDDGFRANV